LKNVEITRGGGEKHEWERTDFCFGNLKGEHLLKDNIKMDLKEMALKDVVWVHLIQD
jgi:hypothetical protein